MEIRGLQKTTLLDYPGKLACTVFTPGCNFRCPYCYNRDIVLNPQSLPLTTEKEFFDFLAKREKIVDAVVVCGGEPTLQPDLTDFLTKVKEHGRLTKLDTNGSRPEVIQNLLEKKLLDFVAMDIKTTLDIESYERVAGWNNIEPIIKSVTLLSSAKIMVEFRTTVVPTLHTKETITQMATQIPSNINWVIQQFRPKTCLNPAFDKIEPYKQNEISHEIEDLVEDARKIHPLITLRW